MARILVIDDEQHIRIIIQELLTREGHLVNLAYNGEEGMKLAARTTYDLVITDVVMPEKDGLEVLMELKQLVPLVRIIVMTGGGDRLNIHDLLTMAKLLGANRVLPKPLDFDKLPGVVAEVLAEVK
jgi:DNA-binding NtrC family response regulator